MMEHTFTVYLKVRGQGRPRVHPNGRSLYKDKADKDYERKIKEAYINSGGGWFGNRPLEMIVETYRSLPKSAPKKVSREYDTKKPDATNVAKACEDALNGIAYVDDAQIVDIRIIKHPRERVSEKLTVTIREVKQ